MTHADPVFRQQTPPTAARLFLVPSAPGLESGRKGNPCSDTRVLCRLTPGMAGAAPIVPAVFAAPARARVFTPDMTPVPINIVGPPLVLALDGLPVEGVYCIFTAIGGSECHNDNHNMFANYHATAGGQPQFVSVVSWERRMTNGLRIRHAFCIAPPGPHIETTHAAAAVRRELEACA